MFGEPRLPEVWTWKYFANEQGTHSWVADTGDRLVFHCGATPVPFRTHGTLGTALQLTDFMKDPGYADGIGPGGAFVRTTSAFFADVVERRSADLMYGFPGERHRLAGEKILDYKTAFPVHEARLEPDGSTSGQQLRALDTDVLARFDKGDESDVRMVRSPQLLKWRYLDRPGADYWYLGEEPGASAILRQNQDEFRLMEIGGEISSGSIEGLARRLAELGRPVVGWFSPVHPVGVALAGAGFVFGRRDHSLAAAWFSSEADARRRKYFDSRVLRESDFYYTLGDYDVW